MEIKGEKGYMITDIEALPEKERAELYEDFSEMDLRQSKKL